MTECKTCKSKMLEIIIDNDWTTFTCLQCCVANWEKSTPLTQSDKRFIKYIAAEALEAPHD